MPSGYGYSRTVLGNGLRVFYSGIRGVSLGEYDDQARVRLFENFPRTFLSLWCNRRAHNPSKFGVGVRILVGTPNISALSIDRAFFM